MPYGYLYVRRLAVHRLLATAVFAYAGLAAAQWGNATRWIYSPPGGRGWCGNVVSDPFNRIITVVAPLAAVCSVLLVRRCIKTGRWSGYAITALVTFAVTSACLFYEARFLGRYGIEIGRVWWLP